MTITAQLPARTRVVRLYRNDAKVLPIPGTGPAISSDEKRGKITGYSYRSRRRLTFLLNNCEPVMDSLLTLTMPPDCSQQLEEAGVHTACRRAILQRITRKVSKQYVWVREYTKAGSLHWHIFLNAQWEGRPNIAASKDWSKQWYDVVRRHAPGFPKMAVASARAEGLFRPAGAYAAKESSKTHQKDNTDSTGMAWWRGSRGLTCPVKSVVFVSEDHLQGFHSHGDAVSTFNPYCVQFGFGRDYHDRNRGSDGLQALQTAGLLSDCDGS